MQVTFAAVGLLNVFQVFGNIVLVVKVVLGDIQFRFVNFNPAVFGNNQLDSAKAVTLAIANGNEVTANAAVC